MHLYSKDHVSNKCQMALTFLEQVTVQYQVQGHTTHDTNVIWHCTELISCFKCKI